VLLEWIIEKYALENNPSAIVFLIFAFLCMVIPYLLGSINPAIVFSKLIYHDDIRTHGSGNGGTTNMLRTFGKKAALLTFVCDMLKTVLSVLFGLLLIGQMGMSIAGFFAGFGHMFPVYYKFKGGKGVACYATVALMISPLTFLGLLFVFLVIVIGTKFVSLASVMAALLYPLLLRAFAPNFSLGVAFAVVETCFIVFMHRENLKRIWNYEESKLDFSKFKISALEKRKQKKAEAKKNQDAKINQEEKTNEETVNTAEHSDGGQNDA